MKDSAKPKMRRDEVECLYSRLGPGLLAYACAILMDRHAAEDVLQQVFLNLLRGKTEMADDSRAYLYRAVRNAALNQRRSSSQHVELGSDQAWFEAPSGMAEARLALEAALKAIPDEQREVIVLRIWGGMTLQEAASTVGISPNTAASRYRYGLAKLREALISLKGQ